MPVTPYTDQVMMDTLNLKKYPNPFFDLANTYIPKNIKILFKFCRDFFHTNSFLRNVITKLTEYPITDILYQTTIDADTKRKYDYILHAKLKIKSFLIEIGLDYFTYGNVFISTLIKPKRFLKCSNCKEEFPMEGAIYKFRNFEFEGACPSCKKQNVKLIPKDSLIKSVDNFKLVRWAPENIDIDFNPITGSSTYYYTIPNKIKSLILAGNPKILLDIPLVFLEAMKHKKPIEIDKNNLYHFKYPTLSEDDMGFAKPMILPALKDIYYLQTLRRGNEAIANEHIIPKKTISPANTATMDPFSMSPDTLVQTTNGIKQLQNVDIENDLLITYEGKTTKIVKTILRDIKNIDYMLSIKSFGLQAIETKVNSVHPFRVWNKDTETHDWKIAKELTTEDYTAYPIKYYNSTIEEINTKDFIKKEFTTHAKQLPEKIKLTGDFFEFLGFWVAEGWISGGQQIGFGFHAEEKEYHEFVVSEMLKLLPESSADIRIHDNTCNIVKTSAVLHEFLLNLIGKGFAGKSLKNLYPYLNEERIIRLLRGIYKGDGSFFYEKNSCGTLYPRLKLGLSNPELIFEIRDLVLSLGYYGTIVKDKRNITPNFHLRHSGIDAESLGNLLELANSSYKIKYKQSKYFIKDGFIYSKIQNIRTIKNHIVLSIEVEDETHSYLSLGYINKNSQMNLGRWRSEIEKNIKMWRNDPNYIAVMPIPIQYQEIGGNAKMLLVTQEMRMLEENIINSMGVPIEFIKGGTSFTGSSISLRIVENHFLNYREHLTDFLNYFLLPKLSGLLGYPKIQVQFKKFKMTDDAESKQLSINLNASGKISDAKMLEEFGYDYHEEQEAIRRGRVSNLDDQIQDMEAQAKSQGRGQVIAAQYQARAQQAMADEQFKIKAEIFTEELANENSGNVTDDPYKLIEKYALEIFNLPPNFQQQRLMEMAQKMPVTYNLVIDKLRNLQLNFAQTQAQMLSSGAIIQQSQEPPPPPRNHHAPNEKGVGNREQDKIPLKEKTRGNTRGDAKA